MKYVIDKNSKTSAYMQLYKQLRDDIVNCIYKYADKLPSKRLIASEAQVSVITVEHAYEILCDEGYIVSKQRSGYFVSYKKNNFVPVSFSEELRIKKTTEYFHHENEFPFSVFVKTMRNVISKYSERLLIKSPNKGCLELRNAISKYFQRSKGIYIDEEQIVIGSGAEYLYGLIVQLLGRDKIYGIENPSYEKIYKVYKANGVKCELLKMGKDGILSSFLNKTKADVLHITPFHSYPSGVTAGASKRNEYIEWASKRNGIIIEDDFDSEFTISKKNEDMVFSLEPERSVIYINTFTKTIAPSMRIGYMILPKKLVELFSLNVGFYSCTVPVFEQFVLAEFINNGDFERHINRVRRKRRQSIKKDHITKKS